MESTNCVICGSAKKFIFSDNLPNKTKSVICKKCGLIYLSPMPTRDFYKNFYSEQYWQKWRNVKNAEEDILGQQMASENDCKEFAKSLYPYINKDSFVLDIGCGFGTFLKVIKQQYGCNVAGIEPNKAVADVISKQLDVWNGTIGDFHTDKKFDFIFLYHVLEHLTNPLEAMEKIASLLPTNGYLYIGVPNMCTARKFATLHHPCGYNPKTLAMLLSKYGLKIIFLNNKPMLKKGMDLIATRQNDSTQNIDQKRDIRSNWTYIACRAFCLQKIYRLGPICPKIPSLKKIARAIYKFLGLN